MHKTRLYVVNFCIKLSIYDKAVCVGRSREHEILCPDCFHGISKTGVVFRADQRVYRHCADLHIQVFGSPDFQHGVQGDKLLSVMNLCDTL